MAQTKIAVVIPNWNGADLLRSCISSLQAQTQSSLIIVVENGSVDASDEILREYGDSIVVLKQPRNLGFAGGVNVGIRYAMELNVPYIALLNNDAVAEPDWLEQLLGGFEDKNVGIVTSKIIIADSDTLDSTGDWYTTTGMPFPRGRGERDHGQYDKATIVFGASGGASMYRSELFADIGLFDEDFFAYYEDVDISFRAQLRGWTVRYSPRAVVHHQLSATSSKHGYFAIRQSAKNFWLIYFKNLPAALFWRYLPAALYRYGRMYAARFLKGGAWDFTQGFCAGVILILRKLPERNNIQKHKQVPNAYLESIIYRGKPPTVKTSKTGKSA